MFPNTTKGASSRISFNIFKRLTTKGPNNEIISPVELAYATYENQDTQTKDKAPLLIVHGYLASKRNWVTICKRLLDETKPARKIIAVDLRNHGDSPHSEEHTNLHIVEDLRHFIESFQLRTIALLGHSYGGMASMIFALLYVSPIDYDFKPPHSIDRKTRIKFISKCVE